MPIFIDILSVPYTRVTLLTFWDNLLSRLED